MQYHIDILTTTGQRFDVNATIEMVMGGVSLFEMESRSTSYSTSFPLQRTPANEKLLSFASNQQRSSNPSIPVFVSSGYFTFQGILKVMGFSGAQYDCVIIFSDFNEKINTLFLNDLITSNISNPIFSNASANVAFQNMADSNEFSLLYTKSTDVYESDNLYPAEITEQGAWISASHFLTLLGLELGYTFYADSSENFDELFIFLRDFQYDFLLGPMIGLSITKVTDNANHLCSDVMRALMQIKHCYYEIDELTKKVNIYNIESKLNSTSNIIFFEGFSITNKLIASQFNAINKINYTLDESIEPDSFGSEFNSDGVGANTVFEIGSLVPKMEFGISQGIDYFDLRGISDIVFGIKKESDNGRLYSYSIYSGFYIYLDPHYDMDIYTLDYSFLDKYFLQPIILEVEGVIPNNVASNFFKTKIFDSLKLGGRFWIDSLNYDISTGKSVAKLIKIK